MPWGHSEIIHVMNTANRLEYNFLLNDSLCSGISSYQHLVLLTTTLLSGRSKEFWGQFTPELQTSSFHIIGLTNQHGVNIFYSRSKWKYHFYFHVSCVPPNSVCVYGWASLSPGFFWSATHFDPIWGTRKLDEIEGYYLNILLCCSGLLICFYPWRA